MTGLIGIAAILSLVGWIWGVPYAPQMFWTMVIFLVLAMVIEAEQ